MLMAMEALWPSKRYELNKMQNLRQTLCTYDSDYNNVATCGEI